MCVRYNGNIAHQHGTLSSGSLSEDLSTCILIGKPFSLISNLTETKLSGQEPSAELIPAPALASGRLRREGFQLTGLRESHLAQHLARGRA
jgi:hypothetical protein